MTTSRRVALDELILEFPIAVLVCFIGFPIATRRQARTALARGEGGVLIVDVAITDSSIVIDDPYGGVVSAHWVGVTGAVEVDGMVLFRYPDGVTLPLPIVQLDDVFVRELRRRVRAHGGEWRGESRRAAALAILIAIAYVTYAIGPALWQRWTADVEPLPVPPADEALTVLAVVA